MYMFKIGSSYQDITVFAKDREKAFNKIKKKVENIDVLLEQLYVKNAIEISIYNLFSFLFRKNYRNNKFDSTNI